eukprot:758200-Pleurochrysis_carterae.AAC.1
MDAYGGATGPPYVIMGDSTHAAAYAQLFAHFAVLVLLFMRNTPLCPHEIDLFERTIVIV